MDDESDDQRGGPGRSSTELLDLVRAAEDEARVSARNGPPSVTTPREDVIDVGDDAVDAPPSDPSVRLPMLVARSARSTPPRVSRPSLKGQGTPPLVAIALLFALVAAVLALLAR